VASGCESRRGRYGTQSVRSCDRAGGQVATRIRWTLPELKRGPAAGNRHGGAPSGAVPVATGCAACRQRGCRAVFRQRDRRPVRASRRSAHPSFGVGTRKQHDPRAERRAETRCDGMMEETEEDVRWKSEDRKNAKRSAGGLYQSTTVILRCERKRASKDERPVPCDGSRAVALRGPRFARAPQGDGHNRMRAA
jgi:hypothetical protein